MNWDKPTASPGHFRKESSGTRRRRPNFPKLLLIFFIYQWRDLSAIKSCEMRDESRLICARNVNVRTGKTRATATTGKSWPASTLTLRWKVVGGKRKKKTTQNRTTCACTCRSVKGEEKVSRYEKRERKRRRGETGFIINWVLNYCNILMTAAGGRGGRTAVLVSL